MTWETFEAHEFYFVAEAAQILRMSERELRRLMKRRRLPYHQIDPDGRVRIAHADLMAFLAATRIEVLPEPVRPARPRKTQYIEGMKVEAQPEKEKA